MDAHAVARVLTAGRIALGALMTVAPERVAATWVGGDASRTSAQVLATALGIRDLAIGAGGAAALWRGDGARPWLLAGAASDLVDLVATVRARERLPLSAVAGVTLVAGSSTVLGLWALASVD